MKICLSLAAALLLAFPVEAKPRVAILNTQEALLDTADGKAASAAMQRKFASEASRLSAEQEEIDRLRRQLGEPDGAAEERASLKARIAALTHSHRRLEEDLQVEAREEERRVLQDLAPKLLQVVEKYARKKHFEVVLDVSDPRTPVYWRASATDITREIVKQYELAHPRRP